MESSLFWTVAELMVNVIEVTMTQWYLHMKLRNDPIRFRRLFIGGAIQMALLSLYNYLNLPDAVRLPLLAIGWVAYSLILYRGPLGRRIFQPILAFIILGMSDMLAVSLLTFIPGATFDLMTQPTIYRLQGMVATKILFVSILFFMVNITPKKTEGDLTNRPLWLLFLVVPIMSGGILATLIQYELLLNDSSTALMLIATLGILIINLSVLILLQVLSENSRKVLNQEMLLQQNDIQAKYFSEIKSTNDSLRGFRHDLNNHLQVLDGYMSLGKYDKAKAYLREIGDFISLTESITNTGHALLDAVISAKITYAKKLNIKVNLTLQVPGDLPLTQLELCTVLGNILDNAIESCQRLQEGPIPKELSLSIDQFAGHLRVLLKNTAILDGNLDLTNMVSVKKEPGHGIGLSNMKRVVAAHGGNVQMSYEENRFTVLILLPLNA